MRVQVFGTRGVAASFRVGSAEFAKEERKIVRRYGQLLETRIKAKASGRPGPNAPTGDYRRSWSTRFFDTPVGPAAQVGTNAPQGRRLEFGFNGIDSLGRSYNQPPYPHVGPAADEIEPQFLKAIEKAVPK